MKTEYQLLIFAYFLCVIVITILLFSFVFNTITTRLFGNYPQKTKIYYLEIFGIWLIFVYIMFNIRTNFNQFSKKNLTHYISSNGENGEYSDIYSQIDEMEKFDLVIIIGFIIIFFGSQQHTYTEKLSLLNEDIGLISKIIR
jgi:hypothetical protein